MSAHEMSSKVKELRELKRMQEELAAEIESVQDAIKAEMTARATDTLNGEDYKITWKEVTSTRLDTTALKKALPEVAIVIDRVKDRLSALYHPHFTRRRLLIGVLVIERFDEIAVLDVPCAFFCGLAAPSRNRFPYADGGHERQSELHLFFAFEKMPRSCSIL